MFIKFVSWSSSSCLILQSLQMVSDLTIKIFRYEEIETRLFSDTSFLVLFLPYLAIAFFASFFIFVSIGKVLVETLFKLILYNFLVWIVFQLSLAFGSEMSSWETELLNNLLPPSGYFLFSLALFLWKFWWLNWYISRENVKVIWLHKYSLSSATRSSIWDFRINRFMFSKISKHLLLKLLPLSECSPLRCSWTHLGQILCRIEHQVARQVQTHCTKR